MNTKGRYLGFDPGGKKSFGWGVLDVDGENFRVVKTGTCSSAVEALKQARDLLENNPPLAVGIDAPLYWVEEGDRTADKEVRGAVEKGKTSSVLSVNSLRGACLAQGVIIARLVRSEWPNCLLAEAHPKALLAVPAADIENELQLLRYDKELEHERDAILAAYSAWATAQKRSGWRDVRDPSNKCVKLVPNSLPQYWFPARSK